MAEEKKSFIAYADWLETFEMLEDVEAGKMIKHLLRYVNDLNPEMDDRMLKILFNPIKLQLKRDLKKYEQKKDFRSEAGRLGNLKRYHSDLYLKVQKNELSIDEAEELAKVRKASQDLAKARKGSQNSQPDKTSPDPTLTDETRKRSQTSQTVANLADNDTVNVNDNVNENDINKRRAYQILLSEKQSELETFAMQNNALFKNTSELKKCIESFNDKMDLECAQGKIEFSPDQLMPRFKSYGRNWSANNIKNTPDPESYESGKLNRF